MSAKTIEYVSESDTIADIALKESTSASLRTSTAIIIALIVVAAFILNLLLITTILAGKKLRSSLFHRLLCHLSLVNIVDLGFSVFLSLLYVANGVWSFGSSVCRMNAFLQQFCQIYTLMSIVIMALERAVDLSERTILLFGGNRTKGILLAVFFVALACTVPSTMNVIPVKTYKNRYLCAVDDNCPIVYTIVQTILYIIGCGLMLVCAGAILSKRKNLSIPVQSQDYSQFITKTRALQEGTSLGKLIITVFVLFALLEGPYILLCMVVQIRNSKELVNPSGGAIQIPPEADTLITWLKFLFPLLCPIFILCWCSEVWSQLLEIFCCKSSEPPTIGQFIMNGKADHMAASQVMTLIATPQGLQLRMPAYSQFTTYPTNEVFQAAPPYEEHSRPSMDSAVRSRESVQEERPREAERREREQSSSERIRQLEEAKERDVPTATTVTTTSSQPTFRKKVVKKKAKTTKKAAKAKLEQRWK